MSTLNNLTAIIITHRFGNELDRAVESVKFAEKIILINYCHNHQSIIGTSNSKIKIINTNQALNNFSQARNRALKYATTEWVLFIDSDEIFNSTGFNQLKRILNDDSINGIYINRNDLFLGKKLKYGELSRKKILRIARKNKITWIKPVHEVAIIQGKTVSSQIAFFHYAHQSLIKFFNKVVNYSSLDAKSRKQNLVLIILSLIFLPISKFIFTFFLKLGFLDGWRGFSYSYLMSLHSLFVRVFQYENQLQ